MKADPAELFGGWPFIDNNFNAEAAFSATVALRAYRSAELGLSGKLPLWEPTIGAGLFSEKGKNIPSRSADAKEKRSVKRALQRITLIMPEWSQLLRLRVEIKTLEADQWISCSSPNWPQHIFLQPYVYTDEGQLCEQLIHELCHNWIYLLSEGWRLAHPDDQPQYVLYTGTARKYAWEVLGASHVAAALIRWYTKFDEPWAQSRCLYLGNYLRHGLKVIDRVPLSEGFLGLKVRLDRFLDESGINRSLSGGVSWDLKKKSYRDRTPL